MTQYFTCEYVMSDENVEKYLDYEKLKSFRTDTTISGHYLKIWMCIYSMQKK